MKQRINPDTSTRQNLRSDFVRLDDQTFAGYVVDESDLHQRFVVELLVDGYPLKIARADAYANELAIEGLGDGCYGFAFKISRPSIDQGGVVEVRTANTDVPVGHPIFLAATDATARYQPASDVRWLGGLRFDG